MSVFIGYPSFMAYQMMKGKKGNNDDFPSITGMIARYSASGLTNEQMEENPVWKDLTGNGYDLQMKNFAWSGMSGVGGYGDENYKTFYKFTPDQYNAIATPSGVEHMKFTFRVTGLRPENKNRLVLSYFGTIDTIYGSWTKDGIYTVDADIVEVGKPTYFYNGYGATRGEFTIEILPLYPGFILGDGVDDFAVTEKELNFEDTYTVYTAFIPLQNDPIKNMIVCGKDYKKDFYINYGTQLVFYTANSTKSIPLHINQFTVLLCKRDKTTGVIKNLVTGESFQFSVSQLISNPGLYYLWRSATVFSYGKTAIAGQTICNGYFSTDEDDEKVLDWYKKQYPWLFPDQAWTVVGKTNEDEDRATIANITGNGNNLVLSNFGFAEGSGYGLYAENYSNSRWFINNSITATKKSDTFNVTSINQVAVQIQYIAELSQSPYTVPSYTIKVTGLTDGQTVNYRVSGGISYPITQDGIYILPGFDFAGMGSWYGFQFNKVQETCDITIEQIPEYEGYLVTDGVDDKAVSKQFKFGENFTVILDFKFPVKKISYCGFDLSSKVRIQNIQGSGVYVVLKGNKTLIPSNVVRAVTSEGKVYDENWNEYNIVPGNISSNYTLVNLGFDGSKQFAESATKLAGIYSSTLSKDDCIKAYNYLQTLKAK